MNCREIAIDDVRDFGPNVRHFRHVTPGIEALKEGGWEVLYLDYDMGIGCPDGREVLDWLEANADKCPGEICCVSMNPEIRRAMQLRADKLCRKAL